MKENNQEEVKMVLIVSNDTNLCSYISDVLKGDFRVLTAHPTDMILNILVRDKFHVLIADTTSLKSETIKLLTTAKKKYPHLILMMMGENNPFSVEMLDRSLIIFMNKSFSGIELKGLIRQGLHRLTETMVPLSAFDILLLFSLTRENIALILSLSDTNEQGNVYYEEGNITNATYGIIRGEDAFYLISAWKEVDFTERKGVVVKQKDINKSGVELLTEASRRFVKEIALMQTMEFSLDDLK